MIQRRGTAAGNQMLLPERITTSGLYATSGSGFYEAGKRKGLLWKEVDDDSTEMLPHISSVLNVMPCVFGQQHQPLLTSGKIIGYKADFYENSQDR